MASPEEVRYLLERSVLQLVREELPERYQDLEPLASGGMGTLFRALDRETGEPVAVKTVPPHVLLASELVRVRFVREAEALARLSHPSIVRVREIVRGVHVPCFVMDLVQGRTLADWMAERDWSDVREALTVVLEVSEALVHAHFKGVLHRDLKPENLFVMPDGGVRVVDFGLAKVMELTELTHSGERMGTPLYASPEQLTGRPVGPQTDVYSLGVLLFQLLSGRVPFGPGEVMQKVHEPAPAVTEFASGITARLAQVVASSLATRPEDRFPTVDRFKRELSAALAEYRITEDLPAADESWEALLCADLDRMALEALPARERIELAEGEVRDVTLLVVRLSGLGRLEGGEAAAGFARDRIQRALAAEVERFGGAVDGFREDGLFGWFGSRTTAGTDVEQAVRAGLGILEKVSAIERLLASRGLSVKAGVGIDLARVTVGERGAIDPVDLPLLAPGAELEPGRVRVTEAACERLGEGFRTRPLGSGGVLVEGLVEGVPGGGSRPSTRARLPLVGRERELATLLGWWQEAIREPGPRPWVVAIAGEPGVGKTRLVQEFLARPGGTGGVRAVWAPASSYERTPYLCIGRALSDLLAIPGGATQEAIRAGIEASLEGVPEASTRSAALGFVLGLPRPAELSPTALKQAVVEAVEAAVRQAAAAPRKEAGPLVLVFQDFQWRDESSREVIENLLVSLDGTVMVILLHRFGFPIPERWKRVTAFRSLDLAPLDREASRRLVEEALDGRRLDDASAEAVVARSGGNPLFLGQGVEYLLDRGTDPAGLPEVPGTVQAVVLSRFDLLPRREREVLQLASVLGARFEAEVLDEMDRHLRPEGESLEAALARLEAARFLVPPEGTGPWRFREEVTRDAVYSTLLASNRQLLHGLAAQGLALVHAGESAAPADDLAFHFNRSDQPGKALEATRAALVRAVARYDVAAALTWADEALRLLSRTGDDPAVRFEILGHRVQVLELTGRVEEQGRALEELATLAERLGEPVRIASVENRRSWYHWWNRGDCVQAKRHAEAALASAERAGDIPGSALAWRNLGSIANLTGEIETSLLHHGRAASLYAGCGDKAGQAASLLSLALNRYAHGEVAMALQAAEMALGLDRQLGELRGVGRELRHLGEFHVGVGRYREGLAEFGAALENDRRIGYRKGAALNRIEMGRALLDLSDPEEARSCFLEARELAEEIGASGALIEAMVGLSRSHRAIAGDLDPAGEVLGRTAFARAGKVELPAVRILAASNLAAIRLAQGRTEEAARLSDEAAAWLQGPVRNLVRVPEVLLARHLVLAALGRPEAAEVLAEALATIEARAARLGDPDLVESYLERIPVNRRIRELSAPG